MPRHLNFGGIGTAVFGPVFPRRKAIVFFLKRTPMFARHCRSFGGWRIAPRATRCLVCFPSSLASSQFHLSLSFKIERYIPAIKEIEPRSLCPFVPQIHALSTWCIEAGSRCYFYFCWVPLLWARLLLLVSFSHESRYFSPS